MTRTQLRRSGRFSAREHSSSILVAALSSAFAVTLVQVNGVIATILGADDVTGTSGTVAILLGLVSGVFIVIAGYVGAVVTANTFQAIIAGRVRTIALRRLIGSTSARERRSVAREGLRVGMLGAVVGAAAGTAFSGLLLWSGTANGFLPSLDYSLATPVALFPVGAVAVTTWAASWVGSRRVLTVSPMEAIGAAGERSHGESVGRRRRNTAAVTLFVIGGALLGAGILLGLLTPAAVLVGLVGGLLSFTGLVLGAELVMPPALRLIGRLLGRSAPARLAAENAVRYPERSARTTIGLVIGVTLVTMFAVALQSYLEMIRRAQEADSAYYAGIDDALMLTVTVFSVLIGFSAIIAAVGLVNNLSLSVLQRTREIGLLRALGFTGGQVRRMIVFESAQLTGAAVLVGLVLGTCYGWAGAQSLLGSINGGGLVVPAVPLLFVAAIIVAAAVLTWSASVAPSRRATRVAPVEALAAE